MAVVVGPSFPLSGIITAPPTSGQAGTGLIVTRIYKITGDTSYPSGGTALNAASFGLTTLLNVIPFGMGSDSHATNVPVYSWDAVNSKLLAHATAAGATGLTECTAAGNLSGSFVYLLVNGIE